jgi:multicomponent Na+:H+ antiporter subunit B
VTPRLRLGIMLAAAAGLLGFLVWGVAGLPDFGHYAGPYGTTINHVVSTERQATNAVTAIVFDYRGYDTLGEELILFISVVGVTLLVREQRDEHRGIAPEAEKAEGEPIASDAVRVLGVALAGIALLVGLSVVAHGGLTPGGGFQGGVILGAAVLLVYFAGDFVSLRQLEPSTAMELMHSGGAAGLAMIGLGGLLSGAQAFHNFLYTGTTGELISGGFIPLGNAAVGLEVFGAVLLLGAELLHEAALLRR